MDFLLFCTFCCGVFVVLVGAIIASPTCQHLSVTCLWLPTHPAFLIYLSDFTFSDKSRVALVGLLRLDHINHHWNSNLIISALISNIVQQQIQAQQENNQFLHHLQLSINKVCKCTWILIAKLCHSIFQGRLPYIHGCRLSTSPLILPP